MSESQPTPVSPRNARIRVLLVAGVLPLLVAGAAALLINSWRGELPDPIAIHWSGAPDAPDGFGSVDMVMLVVLLTTLGFAVLAVAMAWRVTAKGLLVAGQKIMAAGSPWLAVFLSVLVTGSVWIQRGLDDAATAGPLLPWLGIGLVAAFVVAAAAWPLLPAIDPAPAKARSGVEPSAADAGSAREWQGTARMATGAMVIIAGSMVVVAGLLIAIGPEEGLWLAVSVLVLVGLIGASMFAWRVRVDERGLTVVSMLGWPRTSIPPAEIRSVEVAEISPMRDFGGWGWRMDSLGRSGVVVRKGPAIEVERTSGRRFVVTVDGAETGAAVLSAIIGGRRRIR